MVVTKKRPVAAVAALTDIACRELVMIATCTLPPPPIESTPTPCPNCQRFGRGSCRYLFLLPFYALLCRCRTVTSHPLLTGTPTPPPTATCDSYTSRSLRLTHPFPRGHHICESENPALLRHFKGVSFRPAQSSKRGAQNQFAASNPSQTQDRGRRHGYPRPARGPGPSAE